MILYSKNQFLLKEKHFSKGNIAKHLDWVLGQEQIKAYPEDLKINMEYSSWREFQ